MKYRVLLRRNSDGVERWTGYDLDCYPNDEDAAGLLDFMWRDGGNFSCDCNRALFFNRAAGDSDGETSCGDTAFDVLKIERSDGAILTDAGTWETTDGRP